MKLSNSTKCSFVLMWLLSAGSGSLYAQESAELAPSSPVAVKVANDQAAAVRAVKPRALKQKPLEPKTKQALPSKTAASVVITAELLRDLEAQRKQLSFLKQSEDAFSLALGENYVGYGNLLAQAGRTAEALDAYAQGLHVQKVNYGIYSMEQRPLLKKMFDIYLAQKDAERIADTADRLLWIESENPVTKDDFSYQVSMSIGYFYLDQVLSKRLKRDDKYKYLNRASDNFSRVMQRYKDDKLDDRPLPYGELAWIGLAEDQLLEQYQNGLNEFSDDPRFRNNPNLRNSHSPVSAGLQRVIGYLRGGKNRARHVLRHYMAKAVQEESVEHSVIASLALGDFNRIVGRRKHSDTYYRDAWRMTQLLAEQHQLRQALKNPVLLPQFPTAKPGFTTAWRRANTFIPMTFAVSARGIASKFKPLTENDPQLKYFGKARKALKVRTYRSSIVDGKSVDHPQVQIDAGLFIKPRSAKADKAHRKTQLEAASNKASDLIEGD